MLAMGRRSTSALRLAFLCLGLGLLLLAATSHAGRFGIPTSWSEAPSLVGMFGSIALVFGAALVLLLLVTRNLDRRASLGVLVCIGIFVANVPLARWTTLARYDEMLISAAALNACAFVALLWRWRAPRIVALVAGILSVTRSIALTIAPRTLYTDESGTWMMTAPGVYEPLGGLPAFAREASQWLHPVADLALPLALLVAALTASVAQSRSQRIAVAHA